ncbi:diguanylate cyclase domain-containing protein [Roseofilum casamattae]|uniref:Diguanylate cyclase n=1 Tax=Roseofilum casamattae BLCC-M143 TaxID=3022442 RepID=A0ABT7BW55_9CYAN|nr:diguanylate cyclase [Roseofilum casamattae]MDJ1183434.1 diguanylate cyclase [Roseofilum casamattae BLCC-M143]
MADRLSHNSKTIPLQIFILIPFVLPILIIMGLTGIIGLRSDREPIEKLAIAWMSEVSDGVAAKLADDLALPERILNSSERLFLDSLNPTVARNRMHTFIKDFRSIEGIYLAAEGNGDFYAAFRNVRGQDIFQQADSQTEYRLTSYPLDSSESKDTESPLEISTTPYNVRQLSWYRETLQSPTMRIERLKRWAEDDIIHMQLSRSFFDAENQPIGAGRIDVNLNSFVRYLQELDLEFSGQLFILDTEGNLLASSHGEENGQESISPKLLNRLQQQANGDRIDSENMAIDKQQNDWILTVPYQFSGGDRWWIATVISEEVVFQEFNLHFRNKLLLNLGVLCLAIALGSFAIYRVTSVLNQLTQNSELVMQGETGVTFKRKTIVDELQRSIDISQNVNQYWTNTFQELQEENNRLSDKVAAGANLLVEAIEKADVANIKLQRSQSLLASVINSSMDGIMAFESVRNTHEEIVDFRWIVSNQIVCDFFGLEVKQLVGKYWLQEITSSNLVGLFENYVNVVETGRSLELEFPYDGRGDRFWFHLIGVKLGDGLSVNIRDITDRKKSVFELRKMLDEVHELANTDGLTKVANRRQFDESLTQEWLRLQRDRLPLSLILCDVDYFKFYNDTYGHQAGDDCLIQVAASIQNSVRRSSDLVARYGGEEFVVLLPNTSEEGAIVVAQLIQSKIERLNIPHQSSKVSSSVTMSLGVSTLIPSPELSKERLVTLADEALYLAKQQGRNQFVFKSSD